MAAFVRLTILVGLLMLGTPCVSLEVSLNQTERLVHTHTQNHAAVSFRETPCRAPHQRSDRPARMDANAVGGSEKVMM